MVFNKKIEIIALGGGCHWCTEAVFQSLNGVEKVEQGFVASNGVDDGFSEAVVVHFESEVIGLKDLIEIHLHTHSSTSDHAMRGKYRSAIYIYTKTQAYKAEMILADLQKNFDRHLITKVYPFQNFKPSGEQFQNYYLKNPDKPFCQRFIRPKLLLLLERFSDKVAIECESYDIEIQNLDDRNRLLGTNLNFSKLK